MLNTRIVEQSDCSSSCQDTVISLEARVYDASSHQSSFGIRYLVLEVFNIGKLMERCLLAYQFAGTLGTLFDRKVDGGARNEATNTISWLLVGLVGCASQAIDQMARVLVMRWENT